MFYEDVHIEPGDTMPKLAVAYGYRAEDGLKIWTDPKNASLAALRKLPETLLRGDVLFVPIPWTVVSKIARQEPRGASMTAERDGELGERLSWVQTVYRSNQPIGPNPSPFCVDACTPDDDLPFYYTNAELARNPELRKRFSDYSQRNPPTAAQGATRWRAIVSLAVVTQLRVTVWNSTVWGWDMAPSGGVTVVGPRNATGVEVAGHLNLLRRGVGIGPLAFGRIGWVFRSAP